MRERERERERERCWIVSSLVLVRARDHIMFIMRGHSQEVCGLKWSVSGQQLASGGNDNLLHVWDVASTSEHLYRLRDHQAAVKALAWCPFQANVLASGGGSADRCIKLWNTQKGTCLHSLDTQSQVATCSHRLTVRLCI